MSRRSRYRRNLHRRLPSPAPWYPTRQWVRFEHASEALGLFRYLDQMRARLPGAEKRELDALVAWFGENLNYDVPDCGDQRFWFRAESEVHIAGARRMADLARSVSIPIVERRASRLPSGRAYEDADQATAVPAR